MSTALVDAHPLFSIVTPCLNRAQFIAEAIESVLRQGIPQFEHIIVDGGSTDGTLDILRRYPHLCVISEADQGIYDALNKGIRMARGEVIGHLNSDDLFEDGALSEVAHAFARDSMLDAVYGGASYFDVGADGARRVLAEYLNPSEIRLSLARVMLGVPIINARFFRKRVYDRLGLYDASYRFAADREFLLRVMAAGLPALHLARRAYWYRHHPGSLTIRDASPHLHAILAEHLRLTESYLCRDGVSPDWQQTGRAWHRREAAEGILHSVREGRFLTGVGYGCRGLRCDPWWPLALAGLLLSRLAGWISRRWHGRL